MKKNGPELYTGGRPRKGGRWSKVCLLDHNGSQIKSQRSGVAGFRLGHVAVVQFAVVQFQLRVILRYLVTL